MSPACDRTVCGRFPSRSASAGETIAGSASPFPAPFSSVAAREGRQPGAARQPGVRLGVDAHEGRALRVRPDVRGGGERGPVLDAYGGDVLDAVHRPHLTHEAVGERGEPALRADPGVRADGPQRRLVPGVRDPREHRAAERGGGQRDQQGQQGERAAGRGPPRAGQRQEADRPAQPRHRAGRQPQRQRIQAYEDERGDQPHQHRGGADQQIRVGARRRATAAQRRDRADGQDQQGQFGHRTAPGGPGVHHVLAGAVQQRPAVAQGRTERQHQADEHPDGGGAHQGGQEPGLADEEDGQQQPERRRRQYGHRRLGQQPPADAPQRAAARAQQGQLVVTAGADQPARHQQDDGRHRADAHGGDRDHGADGRTRIAV